MLAPTSPTFNASPAPRPRVLLTGGTGRVAQAIRDELTDAWDIRRCSRVASEQCLANEALLTSTGSLGFDTVVHCAWSCVPANAGTAFDGSQSEDIALLHRWMKRLAADSSPPLFVFMSTGAVYGQALARPSLESDEPHPQGAYAEGKLIAERLLLDSKLPVCVLRVAPLYGLPEGEQKLQGVISHMLAAALRNEPFQQWGDDTVKDYLHRSDFCQALRRIVGLRLQGDVWNVGSGTFTRLSELVSMIEGITGQALVIDRKPSPAWDVRDNRLDITKLSEAIQWRAAISIKDGIAREAARLSARFTTSAPHLGAPPASA